MQGHEGMNIKLLKMFGKSHDAVFLRVGILHQMSIKILTHGQSDLLCSVKIIAQNQSDLALLKSEHMVMG